MVASNSYARILLPSYGYRRQGGLGKIILYNWLGPVAKEQSKPLEQVEQEFLTANRPATLIKRFATTQEIANMIVYVCSEQASATTGAALRVDGGVVRFIA